MTRKPAPIGKLDIRSLPDAFISSLDPKIILTSLAERVSAILNAPRYSVVRLDTALHPGKAFVLSTVSDPSIEGYTLDLNNYPEIDQAFEQSIPILFRDKPDDELAEKIRELDRKMSFPASLVIPLSDQTNRYGVLFFRFENANVEISDESIMFCQLIAFGAALALHNAEELKELTAEVEQREKSAQQLIDVNRLQMETLSAASHDIRVPLNSIIGYTDLLSEGAYGDLDDEQTQVLGHVHDNCHALLQSINILIDHARLEEGKIQVSTSEGEVSRLLDDLRIAIEPLLQNRTTMLNFQIDGNPEPIRTDWAKLKRILTNLLHNAIKFTPEGVVTITAGQDADGLFFEVRDNGVGISKEQLPNIFSQWQRVNPEDAHDPSGLGLSIVKRYADLIGGKIAVSSKLGEGTTFLLRVPLIP